MATIDKLILQIATDGEDGFIKSLNEIDKKLDTTKKKIEETAKGKGVLDKNLSKKIHIKGDKNKLPKQSSELEKVFSKTITSLGKLAGGFLAVDTALKGISALFEQVDKSARTSTSLGNQTRNTSMNPEDVETAQTTLRMMNLSETALDGFMSKLADNENLFKAYGAGDETIQKMVALINGMERSGNKIDITQNSPTQMLMSIAQTLQKNDETTRNAIVTQLKTMGMGSDELKALTNPNFFKYWAKAHGEAIQTVERNKKMEDVVAESEFQKKRLENQKALFGDNFTGLAGKDSKAMAGAYSFGNRVLDDLNLSVEDASARILNDVVGYDEQSGTLKIKYRDGTLDYDGGTMSRIRIQNPFEKQRLDELLKNPELARQLVINNSQEAQDLKQVNYMKSLGVTGFTANDLNKLNIYGQGVAGAQNYQTSNQSQNINIDTLNVTTDSANVGNIVNEAVPHSPFVSDPSNLIPYL